MKEILEIRINNDYANLLFKANEGKNVGASVKVVELTKEDPRFNQIPLIDKQVREKYGQGFYFGWQIKRKYSKKELDVAPLFYMKFKSIFEPAGEECGTIYDETVACEICGANRKQVGVLKLKKNSIPNKDIAKTIAGEIVISERLAAAIKRKGLKGILIEPIAFDKGISNYFQLIAFSEIELSNKTVAGIDPFDFSESNEGIEFTIAGGYDVKINKEVYRCPKGHTIGLNLLSEPYVLKESSINAYDIFISKQKLGVKRGLLRPEPIYFCSPAFRKMVEEEKLSGFEFEIANIQ